MLLLRRTVAMLCAFACACLICWWQSATQAHVPEAPILAVTMLWTLIARSKGEVAIAVAAGTITTLAATFWLGDPGMSAAASALAVAIGALVARVVVYSVGRAQARRELVDERPAATAPSMDPIRLVSLQDCGRLALGIAPAAVLSTVVHALAFAADADHALDLAHVLSWGVRAITTCVCLIGPALALRWTVASRSPRQWLTGISSWPPAIEVIALLVLSIVYQWAVFGSGSTLPIGYATLVLVVWAGLRLPQAAAALHGLAMGLSVYLFANRNVPGPFTVVAYPPIRSMAVDGYILMATSLAMLVSMATGERRALVASLNQSMAVASAKAEAAERLFVDAPHGNVLLTPDGMVLRTNPAFASMFGSNPQELVGRHISDLPDDQSHQLEWQLATAMSNPGQLVRGEWTIRGDRTEPIYTSFSARMLPEYDDGRDAALVNFVDISDRHRYEQRLAHMAEHDALTGLANRRRFDRALAEHVDQCERYGPAGSLVLLDLDNFKDVNDTLGHNAGDEVIVTVAQLLKRSMRTSDLVARIGGDEFAVLLPRSDHDDAAMVAGRIVRSIEEWSSTLDGVHRRVRASAGVVTFAAAEKLDAEPFALADMMMYDAKDAGRNQIAVLDDTNTRQPRTGARMAWRSRIERALENNDFELYLQPILHLESNEVFTAEALLRLTDTAEPVLPGRFMYIVEKAGMAADVDAWVIKHATEMLERLRQVDPTFVLEVNVSAQSLGSPVLEGALDEALNRTGIDPCALILEVTETAAVGDVEVARDFARRISSRGVRFALDDFGAGFGSYYYLKHLDLDVIKIDGEFVSNVHSSRIDESVVRSIVGVAKDLGKQTVAEFVDQQATLDTVRALGVDYAQGYLIGRPVTELEFMQEWMWTRPGLRPLPSPDLDIPPTDLVQDNA